MRYSVLVHILSVMSLAVSLSGPAAASAGWSAAVPSHFTDTAAVSVSDTAAAPAVDAVPASAAVLAAVPSRADSLLRKADSCRLGYDFIQSVAYYRQALEAERDSLRRIAIVDRKLQAENGASMMEYVYSPSVVARHRFSIEDFFLYYPLKDRSWRQVPNVLDTLPGHPFAKAVYVPDGSTEIYFSAEDEDGVRNIWHTEYRDTVWSLPSLLNEQVTSSADEVYPLVSSDGKYMYFSSAGLYGVGGYDLYVSEWDEDNGDWGVPVNMGFPYSSPYDDLLFCNTPDGRYTMFASNRDCPRDSIYVYVLEYDNMPIHEAVPDVPELKKIMSLEPDRVVDDSGSPGPDAEMPENPEVRRYMEKMQQVKALRDSIYAYGVSIDEQRNRYAESNDEQEKTMLSHRIMEQELALPVLNDSLRKASAELQKIEMDFLFNGVVIDLDKVSAEADREIVPKDIDFSFVKMEMGDSLTMNIEQPEPEFDYTFMVLPEGRFAEDNTLPSGIVYQIQIFSITRPATVKEIKGLSPVFLHRPSAGRYTYAVGLFRTYADALSQLNKVRTRGFKGAYIIAFRDGEPIPVNSARKYE